MTIRKTGLMLSTVCAFTLMAATRATAQPLASDVDPVQEPTLRNLDAALNRTGEVAVPDLHAAGNGILGAAATAEPRETRVRSSLVSPPSKTLARISLREDPALDFRYGDVFAVALEECRFDVARRLGVNPAKIEAGIVSLRWTIEPSGLVRDVSVVASSPTDEGVTTCARLLVANRVLVIPVEQPAALEWSYAFRKLPAVPAHKTVFND